MTKAAETFSVLVFLADKLRVNMGRWPGLGPRLLGAAQSMVDLIKLFDASGPVMSVTQIQTAFNYYQQHLSLTNDIAELHIPKRHAALHLLGRMAYMGSPRMYANWFDESLNRTLKLACRTTSQVTFEESVLLRMAFLTSPDGSRGQKRPTLE